MKIITEALGMNGVTWYRGAGALSTFQKSTNHQVTYSPRLDWDSIKSSDILFLVRPYSKSQLDQIAYAKNVGTKVWIDYDDNLFAVPTDNPAYPVFSDPQVIKNIETALFSADVVSVSTAELVDKFSKLTVSKPKLLPNVLDSSLGQIKNYTQRKNKVVMWRGSATHTRDLMEHEKDIVALSKEFPDVTWLFLGFKPWFLEGKVNNLKHIENQDVMNYFKTIQAINPNLTIVPLHDSPFNRSKSNIAAIEATFSGSMVVAPDWPEWKMPGVNTYKQDFFDRVAQVLVSDDGSDQYLSRLHVERHLSHDTGISVRNQIVESLMSQ